MREGPAQRARFLIELAVPSAGRDDVERMLRQARQTADDPDHGTRLIRSIFVPEDGSFYLLYEADSAEDARLAVTGSELEVVGIFEAGRGHDQDLLERET